MSRGPGNLKEQIKRLKGNMNKKEIAAATKFVADHSENTVRLAAKLLPPRAANGLGTRIEGMLSLCPVGKQAEMRKMLLSAKSQSKA